MTTGEQNTRAIIVLSDGDTWEELGDGVRVLIVTDEQFLTMVSEGIGPPPDVEMGLGEPLAEYSVAGLVSLAGLLDR